jgi:hypothetical protein
MKYLAIAVWALMAFYSLLCIFLPEVRPYYRGLQKKFGLFASLGLAHFFWFLPLVYACEVTGLVGTISPTFKWAVFCLLMFVAIIGSWIEYLSD